MGVAGLWSFLKKNAMKSFSGATEEALRGKRLALDGGMFLTTCLKVTVALGEEEEWREHFKAMVQRRLSFIRRHVGGVVLVLDGPACDAKRAHAHLKRQKARDEATEKMAQKIEEGDMEGALKAKKACTSLTKELQSFALVGLSDIDTSDDQEHEMGVLEILQAPGEAEMECARLTREEGVWAVATEDGDALVAGATRLVRGMCGFHHSSLGLNGWEVVDLTVALDELNMTPSQFRWMSIFAGTDFHPGLKGVGCARAKKLLAPYPLVSTDNKVLEKLVPDGKCREEMTEIEFEYGTWDFQ